MGFFWGFTWPRIWARTAPAEARQSRKVSDWICILRYIHFLLPSWRVRGHRLSGFKKLKFSCNTFVQLQMLGLADAP